MTQPALFELQPKTECCAHGVHVLAPRCPRCAWWQDADLSAEDCQRPWTELEARYLRETE